MKWQGKRQSSNVEDRRGASSGKGFGGNFNPMLIGLLLKLVTSKKGLLIVGIVIAFFYFTGTNPLQLLMGEGQGIQNSTIYKGTPKEEELAQFTTTVLANTEDIWNQLLSNYKEPKLVLFTDAVTSACGSASSATGPFYCPGDEKIYIDLSFFQEMETKLNAGGDFAQAYVIAHEVGHHIQNLMGTTDKLNRLRGQVSKVEYNKLSVKLELQADFLAGVWAHHSQKMMQIMEKGDLEEALNAAFQIGDDRLQKQATGRVVPDSFTHGTSKQRMYWFKKGFETGDINQGDTFNATSL